MSDAALFSGSCGATQASDPRDLSRSTTKGDSIVRPSPRAGVVTQQSFSMLEGEKMAPLRAEFGISRKTGYKINDRYKMAARSRSARLASRLRHRADLPKKSHDVLLGPFLGELAVRDPMDGD
jgi:hypothetical protein